MKRHYGRSAQSHLMRLRIDRAGHLLRQNQFTLEAIAAQTGYGNAYALSKAFKKVMGTSPREFRSAMALSSGVE
jgi:transcriptional regulator GlxA family with amidase domain